MRPLYPREALAQNRNGLVELRILPACIGNIERNLDCRGHALSLQTLAVDGHIVDGHHRENCHRRAKTLAWPEALRGARADHLPVAILLETVGRDLLAAARSTVDLSIAAVLAPFEARKNHVSPERFGERHVGRPRVEQIEVLRARAAPPVTQIPDRARPHP